MVDNPSEEDLSLSHSDGVGEVRGGHLDPLQQTPVCLEEEKQIAQLQYPHY